MLFLVRELIESKFTSIDRTQEGSLPSVNPHVIEQIVPFSEQFMTAGLIADENTESSTRFIIDELDTGKIEGCRDISSALEFAQIQVVTELYIKYHRVGLGKAQPN